MRKQHLVGLAHTVPYTLGELAVLMSMIISSPYQSACGDFYEFSKGLGLGVADDGCDPDLSEKELNFLQYLFITPKYRRVFLFLVLVPMKNVPMYLWDQGLLSIFAQWRTKIEK